jgi:RNA polymerase sigma-32 factor
MQTNQKAGGRERSLSQYLRQVGRVPPLTPGQERTLTEEYARSRDPGLARRIASANLRLVIKMAAGYARRSSMSLEDLIQEGTIGLMEALERYDPARGVRFATYATWWIRAFLLKHLVDGARLVRAGRTRADRQAFFRGGAPPVELSLDAPADATGEGPSLLEAMAGSAQSRPDQLFEEAEALAVVQARAERFERGLSPRQAVVFRERVLHPDTVHLRELASRFGVSRERIRQIEKGLEEDFRTFALAA